MFVLAVIKYLFTEIVFFGFSFIFFVFDVKLLQPIMMSSPTRGQQGRIQYPVQSAHTWRTFASGEALLQPLWTNFEITLKGFDLVEIAVAIDALYVFAYEHCELAKLVAREIVLAEQFIQFHCALWALFLRRWWCLYDLDGQLRFCIFLISMRMWASFAPGIRRGQSIVLVHLCPFFLLRILFHISIKLLNTFAYVHSKITNEFILGLELQHPLHGPALLLRRYGVDDDFSIGHCHFRWIQPLLLRTFCDCLSW